MSEQDSKEMTILPCEFTFYFSKQLDEKSPPQSGDVKEIGSFQSAEEFWGIFQYMKKPVSLQPGCRFHLFRKKFAPALALLEQQE